MSDNSQRIYDHAKKDLGLKETPGSKSTPRIKQAIKQAASWLDDDDSKTPWCGCLRGLWGLETGTGVPKEHYRAKAWLEWGKSVLRPSAKRGDTVIFNRAGGGHVALLDRFNGDFVFVLGGNQSNACNISRYKVADIIGIRRA